MTPQTFLHRITGAGLSVEQEDSSEAAAVEGAWRQWHQNGGGHSAAVDEYASDEHVALRISRFREAMKALHGTAPHDDALKFQVTAEMMLTAIGANVQRLKDRLSSLEEAAAKLNKTADGIIVGIGDEVYAVGPSGVIECIVNYDELPKTGGCRGYIADGVDILFTVDVRSAYSTRALAEAARGGGGDE